MAHPLKICCLASLGALLLTQLSLLVLPASSFAWYWALLLSLPLLLPLSGFVKDRLYTYKWAGFLTLFYFCLGISELVSNPELRVYGYLTTVFSTTLFISDIYYTRFLRLTQKRI
jgi:uncharacterized membrane protein